MLGKKLNAIFWAIDAIRRSIVKKIDFDAGGISNVESTVGQAFGADFHQS